MKKTVCSKEFKRIIDAFVRPAVIACFKKCGYRYEVDDVDEVICEVNLKLTKFIDRYDENISTGAWFSKIAYNCTCDYMKREGDWKDKHRSLEFVTADDELCELEFSDIECAEDYRADMRLISAERVATINRVLLSLGEEDAKLLGYKIDGYTDKEISACLGVSDGACRTRISRVRAHLRQNKEIRLLCSEIFGDSYANVA